MHILVFNRSIKINYFYTVPEKPASFPLKQSKTPLFTPVLAKINTLKINNKKY